MIVLLLYIYIFIHSYYEYFIHDKQLSIYHSASFKSQVPRNPGHQGLHQRQNGKFLEATLHPRV